jgi:uncharacterized membrane protein
MTTPADQFTECEDPCMAFCPSCGKPLPAGAATCPDCASAPVTTSASAAQGQVGGLTQNVAGALAYVTIIPAVLFLLIEPYNKNRFVRFHAFHSIFFHVAWIVLWIGLGIFGHLPFLGWASLLLWPLVGLAGFVIWLILVFKAYQGQMFKLPVIGDMAEKQANTV